MIRYDDFFDQLEERLKGRGFSVTRKIESGNDHYELFASRPYKPPSNARRTCYIIATNLDAVNDKTVRDYSKRAFGFGLANRKPHLPRGLGGGMEFFPVIVSDDITDELKAWMRKSMPEVHFMDVREFPVLISPKERKIYYFGCGPPIGWEMYQGFIKFVENELGFH